MKELETIVIEAQRALESGKSVALATVVGIEGSAYRLPGARMLIVDGKWIAGSISGGCLEDDVVLRAAEALARNEALVTTYDTTSDDDIVFGVGLGCKGVITLLIEPVRPNQNVDFIGFAKSCLHDRVSGVAATLIRTQGSVNARVGSRVVAREGAVLSDIGDAALARAVTGQLQRAPEESSIARFDLPNGNAEVFIEHIEPPLPLVIFGGGHDAIPVARFAKALGWHVTVVDHRSAYVNAARFPDADRLVVCTPKDVPAQIPLSHDTLTLVMTHNYLRDRDLLELLLSSSVRYLGLLGPRKRTDQLLADLAEKNVQPTQGQLARLYAPVGLDIGSEGPAEVALSILSEMQAVTTRHRGGHLRERKRPIHQSESAAVHA
jgi:xanthine/CO dehydrogenase XdhC/CoxF family maturation factor